MAQDTALITAKFLLARYTVESTTASLFDLFIKTSHVLIYVSAINFNRLLLYMHLD
jgi:hypothetical protein